MRDIKDYPEIEYRQKHLDYNKSDVPGKMKPNSGKKMSFLVRFGLNWEDFGEFTQMGIVIAHPDYKPGDLTVSTEPGDDVVLDKKYPHLRIVEDWFYKDGTLSNRSFVFTAPSMKLQDKRFHEWYDSEKEQTKREAEKKRYEALPFDQKVDETLEDILSWVEENMEEDPDDSLESVIDFQLEENASSIANLFSQELMKRYKAKH